MHKLLHQVDGTFRPHSFPPVFDETAAGTMRRIHAGQPAGGLEAFESLVAQLEAPLLLLYVLHTPRGEAAAGRYQSREMTLEAVTAFVRRFSAFFRADSRFDLWVHSPSDQATVVLDRHNQLFAYGPLSRFAGALRALGYEQGKVAVDFPHVHQYLPEFDADATALLASLDWSRTDLRPEDEQ